MRVVWGRRVSTAAIVIGLLMTASSALPALSAVAVLRPLFGGPSANEQPTTAAAVPAIALSRVATGLSNPLFVTASPDSTGRLFILEKTGRIRILAKGALLATPFLDIHTLVSTGSEQGLLGLAFPPTFPTSHKFYVDYTNTSGNTIVAEYRTSATNGNVADKATRRVILTVTQPYANHNGGMLAFSAAGYLYVGLGDGGNGGDPGNRAQSTTTLLGKILRLDVSGTTSTHNYRIPSSNPFVGRTGWDEIFQYGVRNPWRFSVDRVTGDLWIGDVGQDSWEEVDHAVKTSSGPGPGVNWGWRVMEGSHCYNPATGCSTSGKVRPVAEYSHASNGRCAITGGYVYRGTAIPALAGMYVFGDYCSGEMFAISSTAPRPAPISALLSTGFPIASFGEDRAGELYVCDLGGSVYKIVAG
jgi:glucose/arabinose dehydrogenase